MAIIKKNRVTGVGKDMGKLEPSYITGENVNSCSSCGKAWQFLNMLNRITIWPISSTNSYISKRIYNKYPHRN